MSPADTTGHSDRRTPAKHDFLNKLVGRHVAAAPWAASKLGEPCRRIVLFDLTAGDGVQYRGERSWEYGCSPGIMAHHGRFENCPVPVEVILFERAMATYDSLLANLELRLPDLGYIKNGEASWTARNGQSSLLAIFGDGRDADYSLLGRGDFVFVNNDPNKVHDFALNGGELSKAVGRGARALSLSTMGCNVGGLKRLPFEGGRDAWFAHLDGVIATLAPTQDVLILAIDGDDSQWGYLAITARKWWERDVATTTKVFGAHGLTISSAWFRSECDQFDEIVRRLFLTAKELGQQ